jgi:hypothetical protein
MRRWSLILNNKWKSEIRILKFEKLNSDWIYGLRLVTIKAEIRISKSENQRQIGFAILISSDRCFLTKIDNIFFGRLCAEHFVTSI